MDNCSLRKFWTGANPTQTSIFYSALYFVCCIFENRLFVATVACNEIFQKRPNEDGTFIMHFYKCKHICIGEWSVGHHVERKVMASEWMVSE